MVTGEKNKNYGGERRHLPDEKHKYEYFWRNHSVFSQWYLSDFEVDGIKFNCTEKYMMYNKAVLMEDYEIADHILALDDPREMKQQARYVRNFDQKLWDENCQAIVEAGNIAKFSQNEKLKEAILKTYPKTLVFACPMDGIWGIGLTEEDPKAWNKKSWRGQNLLGEILTRVRDKLMGIILETVETDGITNTSQSPQKLQFNRFMTEELSVEESKTAQVAVAKTAQVAVAKTAQTATKMENRSN